ncbi:MAG: hypothetical protein AUJ75_02195 [Candidatus Omnitrophica bacterium CG1_02_49_10]|nr:MAG: hypothetical protein AUJ75_02195 [Candidatus Omnitrophica bacterium CG1_02_49_10]
MGEAKKILVVDDEKEFTNTIGEFFEKSGYSMSTALDGNEALVKLDSEKPDLVLLDIKMPGINGIDVLKAIREHHKGVKVIIITAHDEENEKAVRDIGVDGFFAKPIGLQALTDKISEILGSKAPSKEPIKDGTPRAKILMIEPTLFTYYMKEVYLSNSFRCGGFYTIRAAYSEDETFRLLESFRPDIILIEIQMIRLISDLPARIMNDKNRPKEIIIHGIPPDEKDKKRIMELDAHFAEGVFSIWNPVGLIKLSKIIKDAALRQGLVQ